MALPLAIPDEARQSAGAEGYQMKAWLLDNALQPHPKLGAHELKDKLGPEAVFPIPHCAEVKDRLRRRMLGDR